MNSYRKGSESAVSSLRRALFREVLGHLILLAPAILLLCTGLFVGRIVQTHLERHEAVGLPLTTNVAFAKLSQCPVLRGDRIVHITSIKPQSAEDVRVGYQYIRSENSAVSSGVAEFSWNHAEWRPVLCR